MKKNLLFLISTIFISSLFAQEALKSTEEEYYDFLSLQGLVERPTLGYRTLSDSVWELSEDTEHIWQNNNLGTTNIIWESDSQGNNWFTKGFYHGFKYKFYGPEWYNSYNTAAPYGQNDGALWQGKGYNTSLTSGIRAEGYGFEITLKPQVVWSENREFEYTKPNSAYTTEQFINKAQTYGYYGVPYIDSPQRFGDSSFFDYDFGDSEIRYTWNTFTTGFGFQSPWLGPAKINPIIHSNNAPSYPKFDIGMRKTEIYMPYFGWDLGAIEFRGWWGKLSESDYFDNDENNDNNLISGLAVYYAFPGIFDGLSVGFNRTMLSKWDEMNKYSLFKIYLPGLDGGDDRNDQRFSLCFDYVLPKVNLEVYFEWARNDYSPNFDYIIRYPFHTQATTFGIEKGFIFKSNYTLNINLEITHMECSADYDRLLSWYSSFNSHHIITQGYTNKGQWLGPGYGTGGNSQYLGFELIHKKGVSTLFANRINPDLDYTMYIDSKDEKNDRPKASKAEANIRCILSFGIINQYYVSSNVNILSNYILSIEHNPLHNANEDNTSSKRLNNSIQLGIKYNF